MAEKDNSQGSEKTSANAEHTIIALSTEGISEDEMDTEEVVVIGDDRNYSDTDKIELDSDREIIIGGDENEDYEKASESKDQTVTISDEEFKKDRHSQHQSKHKKHRKKSKKSGRKHKRKHSRHKKQTDSDSELESEDEIESGECSSDSESDSMDDELSEITVLSSQSDTEDDDCEFVHYEGQEEMYEDGEHRENTGWLTHLYCYIH